MPTTMQLLLIDNYPKSLLHVQLPTFTLRILFFLLINNARRRGDLLYRGHRRKCAHRLHRLPFILQLVLLILLIFLKILVGGIHICIDGIIITLKLFELI